MSQSPSRLQQILETQIQTLNLTLRPSTVSYYRYLAHGFLPYLHTHFPQLRQLSQLRRDPHLLGWFRWLCAHQPPWSNQTRTTIWSASGAYWTASPPTATPSRRT